MQSLIYPKESHMDFNIACALHFASKCEGYLVREEYFEEELFQADYLKVMGVFDAKRGSDRVEQVAAGNTKAKSYDYGLITSAVKKVDPLLYRSETWVKSDSKVVFSGLGADENFGGYARYKTAFERGGVLEMENEMAMDLDRLWHRNMGRDDRAISANGKETRFPFLDTNLMSFLGLRVRSQDLVDFSAFRGLGDKKLLRELAMQGFGIQFASQVEKRAIQFGTKIAKATNIQKFGSNRKANGKAKYKAPPVIE